MSESMKIKNKKTGVLCFPFFLLAVFALAIIITTNCERNKGGKVVDLVLINGKIWSGQNDSALVEAVAIGQGVIIDLGTSRALEPYIARARQVIDLEGKLLLPGFIDCHTHFLSGGFSLQSVQLGDVRTKSEFIARLRLKATELGPGKWITSGNWDHEKFDRPELPSRFWIDEATADNPVCVNRLDGHMALANTLALKLAGITKQTKNPAGGEIVKDPRTGEPTGILKDAAMDIVMKIIPEPGLIEKIKAAELALSHAAQNGVTSIHEMADASSFEVFQELERQEKLTARLYVYFPVTEVETLARLRLKSPFGSDFLRIAGLKGFVDGSLGSATAAFFEPYIDDPLNTGLFHEQMFPEGIMEKRIREADLAGLQVAIHAIGDKANKVLIDMYEKIMKDHGPRDRRWRVEHAQHLRPEDIERFGKLQLIASVQPYHLIDDGCWAEKKIGPERAKTTYAFKSLQKAGAVLAFGSDWTVAPLNPLEGIYAAVTRQTLDGRHPDGWQSEQKLTVEEAVKAYTVNAAFSEFSEKTKGTIEKGKLADLVVLDRNIFEANPEEIRDARVVMTVVGGKVVFEKK